MSLSARLTIVVGSLVVDSRSLGRVVGVSVARWELSLGADREAGTVCVCLCLPTAEPVLGREAGSDCAVRGPPREVGVTERCAVARRCVAV